MSLGGSSLSLLILVCTSCILTLLSFALWPVFLTTLGDEWGISNSDIGWISGSYFAGYLLATPILVGLTDRFDARFIFAGGCCFSILGCVLFAMLAGDFWTALLSWTLVGSGLAGTYMPGLQIINSRLDSANRIKAVPWYTSCMGIGTGFSFALMGFLLAHFDHHFAGYFVASAAAVALMIILYLIPKKRPLTNTSIDRKRHPLDLRPAFKKPSAFGYILAYGAHSYELFALRTWCFAFLVFLATNVEVSPDLSLITVIVSVITLTGMFSSLIGAHFCLKFGRHKVIAIVGGCAAIMSLIVSLSLKNNFWTVVIFIWFYHSLIMMDSGSLTAGTVEEGDATDRGALLAVHSMVGFGGGALGGPIVGYVLDYNGGSDFSVAWFYALLAMGMGSFFVFLIQFYFFKKNKINQ